MPNIELNIKKYDKYFITPDYNNNNSRSYFKKIEKIAQEIYHASEVVADTKIRNQLKDFEKKGFGKLLLKTAEKIISEKGSNNLWCNARIKAVPFYISCGYRIFGQLFDIQDIGPHYMMYKNI